MGGPTTIERTSSTQFSNEIDGKQFWNELEVEAYFGIPRKTLQNWRVLGKGPRYRKFGSGVRYNRRDLHKWADDLPTGGAGVPSSAVRSV